MVRKGARRVVVAVVDVPDSQRFAAVEWTERDTIRIKNWRDRKTQIVCRAKASLLDSDAQAAAILALETHMQYVPDILEAMSGTPPAGCLVIDLKKVEDFVTFVEKAVNDVCDVL